MIKAIFKATHVFVFVHLTQITRRHIIQDLEDGILRMGTVSGKILCIHTCHVNTAFMCMLLKHPQTCRDVSNLRCFPQESKEEEQVGSQKSGGGRVRV